MRTEIISPLSVYEAVEWPHVMDMSSELEKMRKRLVFILTDRVNREETTRENSQAYKETLALLRGHYNPSEISGFRRYNTSTRRVEGRFDVQDLKTKRGSADRDVAAVLKVLSTLTGRELKTIADLI